MARPRSITDEALLDAAFDVMRRVGPDGVTFAAMAEATGLAAATLVQRFGNKQGLVKSVLIRAWDLLDARTEQAAAETDANPAGAVDLLVSLSAEYPEGDGYADDLLVLREDLRHADLRARGAKWAARLADILAPRLADHGGPRLDRAREMMALWQGTLLWWAFERDQPIAERTRSMLEQWLARDS